MPPFGINPSKMLTDLLSKYLEFDPKQLQLGIWSGDLSMKGVSLRKDAMNPLLKEVSEASSLHDRPPLQIKLIKSEIGHFRFQIPWKRLVWGGGDVRLTLSDVTIVIGFQSQTNCDAVLEEEKAVEERADLSDEEFWLGREEKQEQIREAERLMLQGLSIAPALKAKRRQKVKEEDGEQKEEKLKEASRLEKWLNSMTNSFLWRFFAGLQATIRNVRIVVVQDGVEIGAIVHSIEAGALNEEQFLEMDKRKKKFDGSSGSAPLHSDEEEVELDAGDRQVDKQIKIRGLGGFVRQETTRKPRVPRELTFSTYVTADDYVLRPSEVDVFFSVYYPSKESRKKLRRVKATIVEDTSTVATDQTTSSSKARRGKRDRSVASESTKSAEHKDADTVPSTATPKPPSHKRRRSTATSVAGMSVHSQPLLWSDNMSAGGSRASSHHPRRPTLQHMTPHLDVHLFFGDLRTVCSSRHYHLVNMFCAASARMRNGRPERTILSEIGPDAAPVMRSVTVEAPMTTTLTSPLPTTAESASETGLLSPPILQRNATESDIPTTPGSHLLRLKLLQPVIHSDRSEVVLSWWKYAYANVVWQIRQRKQLRTKFQPSFLAFDWKKQCHLRKEYVNLYISVKLEQRAFHTRITHLNDLQSSEEELLRMEDELSVEQVLLYRSIARALGVRGLHSMPDSIAELHGETKNRSTLLEFLAEAKRKLAGDMHFISGQKTTRPQYSKMSSSDQAVKGQEDTHSRRDGNVDFTEPQRENLFLEPMQQAAEDARRRRDGNFNESPKKEEDKSSKANEKVDGDTSRHRNPKKEEFFPSGDNNESLGSSQINAAGDMSSDDEDEEEELNKKPEPVTKKVSHGTVTFSENVSHDAKTIKTFKTAKSAQTKRSSKGSVTETIVDDPANDVIRFSFALKFRSIELMAFDNEFDLPKSRRASQAQQKNFLLTGVDSFAEEESDDVSELSEITVDQRYFNEEGTDGSHHEETEDSFADNIMSSTDFLLFGMPNSILHLVVSDVGFLVDGNSDASLNASLTISHVEVTGIESCHLLSSSSASTAAVQKEEANNDSIQWSKSLARQSLDSDCISPKAVTALYFETDDEVQLVQCDLSKITTTAEMRAIMKLQSFVSTNVMFPGALIPFSAEDSVRTYMLQHRGRPATITTGGSGGPNIAFRIHGFELTLPMLQEKETDSLRSWDEGTNTKSTAGAPKEERSRISISVELVEYYCGILVDDLHSTADGPIDDTKSQAYYTAAGNITVTPQGKGYDAVRQLRMLDIEQILARQHSFSCQHSVVSLNGIDCAVLGTPDSGLALIGASNLLEEPIDAELLLSLPTNPELDDVSPRQHLVVKVSPILFLLSEARVEALAACILSVSASASSDASSSSDGFAPLSLPPRVEVLADHVLQAVDCTFVGMKLSVVSDTSKPGCCSLSMTEKEIILEETLIDYLSLISCFDLKFPVQEAASAATQICMDRLSVLGLTAQERQDCAEAVRLNFLADVEMMRRSQSEVLLELPDSEETRGSDKDIPEFFNSSTNSDMESVEVEESSDEDSEESLDIVETTIGNAVERTIRLFLPLIEERHEDEEYAQELFVVELEHGARVSVVNLFYDFYVASSASCITVRNGAGIHLLRIGKQKSVFNGTPFFKKNVSNDKGGCKGESFDSSESSTARGVDDEKLPSDHAISFTRFELDTGYDFGKGGLPLSVLGYDEGSDESERKRGRERLDDFFVGDTTVLFSQVLYSEVIQTFLKLSAASLRHQHTVPKVAEQSDNRESNDLPSSLFGQATSFSLFLASDELAPFSQVSFKNVSCRNKLDASEGPTFGVSAKSFSMFNLAPEGQTYPHFIAPLPREAGPTGADDVVFVAELVQSRDAWKEPSVLSVKLSSTRVIVVRQHINELMQFFLSKDYGIGRLKSNFSKADPITDSNGNPQHPLHYKVSVQDSSVLLPRSNTSSEFLAMEVGSLSILNSYQSESWSLPTESSSLVRDKQIRPPTSSPASKAPDGADALETPEAIEMGNLGPERGLSSDTEFQDCLDRIGDSKVFTRTATMNWDVSSFDKTWISRITIQGQQLRLFTALSAVMGEADIENPRFNFFYGIAGRPIAEEPVYVPRFYNGLSDGEAHLKRKANAERRDRKWEEISTNALSLEVVADYAPHLRLLIADHIGDDVTDGHSPPPFSLDMRMSQLYLLLSVWYANMQELPVMFPFSDEQIKEGARAKHPPPDFPEYGTEPYVTWLKDVSEISSEIACIFNKLVLLCSFDKPGYFSQVPKSFPMMSQLEQSSNGVLKPAPLRITVEDCVISIANDPFGILRLACGAAVFDIIDERKAASFSDFISVSKQFGGDKADDAESRESWADLSWGLDNDGRTFIAGLPQPFQLSVFMAADWCLVNLGVEGVNALIFDLSPIWIVLDYFASYFSLPAYGNPVFEATERKEKLKSSRQRASGRSTDTNNVDKEVEGLKIDFRLWLLHPHLCVPGSAVDPASPCVHVESKSGFWFRYKSLGFFSSQEIASTNLSLAVADEFHPPSASRGLGGISGSGLGVKTLIDGLSLCLRYDVNSNTSHTSVSVRMPFLDSDSREASGMCGVTSPDIEVRPIVLPPPTVCTPVVLPTRFLGSSSVCEMMIILELLPIASKLLLNLASGPSDSEEAEKGGVASVADEENIRVDQTFSVCARIGSLRFFVIDPVLGTHLPVAVVSVSSISLTASKLGTSGNRSPCVGREAPRENLQLVLDIHLWADYFKLGTTRSWEPLLEPYQCMVLYEKSRSRGQGMSLNSDSPFHVNVTGALLVTLDESINTLKRSLSEAFGDLATAENGSHKTTPRRKSPTRSETIGTAMEDTILTNGRHIEVFHHIPKPLKSGERVAFSFLNLTGQRIRIHQQAAGDDTASPTIFTYLEHLESTRLSFKATMSVFKNLDVVEVPFPGLPNSGTENRMDAGLAHTVDTQIPGFRWLQGISVDTSGRKFDDLIPRSPNTLLKIRQDWRLENALKLLTEVGLENGGRLITARSPFEIRNNTSHSISLTCHPDPRHHPVAAKSASPDEALSEHTLEPHRPESLAASQPPDSYCESIEPGEAYQIPTLLLESALHLKGSHLGCFWIRPDGDESLFDSWMGSDEIAKRKPEAGWCSRPIQIAKVVHESSVIFGSGYGEDLPSNRVKSGLQVSCHLSELEDTTSFAPFCYVVEIRRSPLVNRLDQGKSDQNRVRSMEDNTAKDGAQEKKARLRNAEFLANFVHGPVAYSFHIHPPIVIENLLPEGGRFELMHASRRTVLWFADLKPGERVPVHSVGLDAPLLLLINLGFCRTPVGEGALVHHGSATSRGFGISTQQRVGLKTIGKAVTKGTKQVGKTLTDIIDSPDKRGQGKVFMIQNPQFHRSKKQSQVRKRHLRDSGTLGLDTGFSSKDAARGKVHRVESQIYSPEDVASETTVVDSVGQRLTLRIENVRGGGGQRRISLFCPFWIVNTTEHSLRYKQEKSSAYVSGTVLSSSQDGSKPVDGSNRNYVSQHKKSSSFRSLKARKPIRTFIDRGTIFAGTPGALATSLGRCNLSPPTLAKLLDKDLPLDKLAGMAFMFNFHEDVMSIGHQRLCVQLGDAESKYTSGWSTGFSLDSVGVTQVVGMVCKEGRALELSVTLSVAPGIFSGYSKIVRFTPRFVLVNQVEKPLRIWQDSSLFHTDYGDAAVSTAESKEIKKARKWYISKGNDRLDKVNQYESLFGRPVALDDANLSDIPVGTTAHPSALYIATADHSELVPFHLADTRSERQLRIDLGYPWNLTSSFSSDITGEYTLKPIKTVDLRQIRHVSTRASPQYRVVLPPPYENEEENAVWDGELGVWFDTDWGGDKRIIVKGTKRGRYAFNHTDIHVGDELLLIDGTAVSDMNFSDAMRLLKERIASVAARQMSLRDSVDVSRKVRRRSTKILRNRSTNASESLDVDSFERVVLTFRTVEERLRRLRLKASKTNRWSSSDLQEASMSDVKQSDFESFDPRRMSESNGDLAESLTTSESVSDLHVAMRTLHNSIYVFVRSQDPESPPFRIENRAMKHVVRFRQRGCDWHSWNSLKPGESRSYTWEEPMRQKKLAVRVGKNNVALFGHGDGRDESQSILSADVDVKGTRTIRQRQLLSIQYVDNEEFGGFGTTKTVKLEEIGFTDLLPCPGAKGGPGHLYLSDDFLHCQVDTDGGTRVLVISDYSDEEEHVVMERHLRTLGNQLYEQNEKLEQLNRLKFYLGLTREKSRKSVETQTAPCSSRPDDKKNQRSSLDSYGEGSENQLKYDIPDPSSMESQARDIAELPDDFAITRCNQVVVQILEATGLNSSDFSGLSNPYCEVSFKGRSKSRRAFRDNTVKRRTYYVEKTAAPKWVGQIFVFDVPHEAVDVTRGHSIRIRVRNFRVIGYHPDLGQTSVHLRSVRNQQELLGWYPLVGRSGRSELDDTANWGCGFVKVRVQWVYNVSGLLDYFILLSERRLRELQHSRDGMKEQLVHAIAEEKRKKSVKDYFNVRHVQNMMGLSSTKLKAGANEDDDDTPNRGKWNKLGKSLRKSSDGRSEGHNETPVKSKQTSINRPSLRLSNARYLWWLHAQTAESRRNRRLRIASEPHVRGSTDAAQIARQRLESINEIADFESQLKADTFSDSETSLNADDLEPLRVPRSPHTERGSWRSTSWDSGAAAPNAQSLPLLRARAASLWSIKPSGPVGEAVRRNLPRSRAYSLPDMHTGDDNHGQFIVRRGSSGYENEVTSLNSSAELSNDILVDVGGIDDLAIAETENEERRLSEIDALFRQGLLYHRGGSYFHRRHLAYRFRQSLLSNMKSSNEFRPKSNLAATLWLHDLKSWTAAQAVLNDKRLSIMLTDAYIDETESGGLGKTSLIEHHTVSGISCSEDFVLENLQLPCFAPPAMLSRSLSRAEDLVLSRNQFEKASRRSLRSVLNPGGWLTIRPITALNLPETYTGMSVKVRYGTEVLTSQTADAKVTPTWAFDDDTELVPRARVGTGTGEKLRRRLVPKRDENPPSPSQFKFDDNDLPVHVEPLQTSGTVRISVIGERLNYKAEIGVLYIPLGAAISCCIESMDDFTEGRHDFGGPSSPFYIRWYPLMSPKDCTPVEGDQGFSARPKESEKLRDSMFSQYFTPCIKLALIWQPDHPDSEVERDSFSESKELEFMPSEALENESTRGGDQLNPSPFTHTYFNADIGRVSVALIDSQRALELLSVSFSDIDVRHSVTQSKTRTTLAVGWLQVDHQDDNGREPVVLAPTPVAHPQPTLQFIMVKDNLRSKSHVDSYNYIAFAAQDMDLTIEEAWMFDLWLFFVSVVRRREATHNAYRRSGGGERQFLASPNKSFARDMIAEEIKATADSKTLLELVTPQEGGGSGEDDDEKKIYVERLLLGLVKINLTYLKGGKKGVYEVTERGGWAIRDDAKDTFGGLPEMPYELNIAFGGLRTPTDTSEIFSRWCEHTHDEELWSENEASGNASYNLPNIIASVFPSVSDARIRLQGKLIEHVFETQDEILASIKNYYVNETLRQIYKIVGSVDFVGNPTMLVNSFFTGVRDFVLTPSKEFIRNPKKPTRIGIGVAKGTLSLVSHSASGLFGFASKVSATAGQVAAVLSFDDPYKKWHNDMVVSQAKSLDRRWKKKGVKSMKEMFTKPVEDVVLGIISGTSGIFVSPYNGAKKGGGLGFVKGVGVGAVGVVVKPVVGVFDAIAHFTGSVHDVAKSVNVLEKRYLPARKLRLPYMFGLKNVLLPFVPIDARSVTLLRKYPIREKKTKQIVREIHVASEVLHMESGVATFVIATNCRVILIKLKKDNNGTLTPSLCWQSRLNRGAAVSSSVQDEGHNGVALTITKRVRSPVACNPVTPPKENQTLPEDISSLHPPTLNRDQSDFTSPDDGNAEPLLGTRQSRVWEELSDIENQETETETHLHGSAKSRKGDLLAWYRVLGEFQHRRQLSRMHNAICCITGDLDSIIKERGLGPAGSQEGYTTFGQMTFEVEPAQAQDTWETPDDAEFYSCLDSIPWVHASLFKQNVGGRADDLHASLVATRKSWLFSNELEMAAQEGGPSWLVHARARTMFVAPKPPPLPVHLDPSDQVVQEIFHQLKQGNISYNQACELIAEHAENVKREQFSTDSTTGTDFDSLQERKGSLDDLFESAKTYGSISSQNEGSMEDIFQSANQSDYFNSARQSDFFKSASQSLAFNSPKSVEPLRSPSARDEAEEGSTEFKSPEVLLESSMQLQQESRLPLENIDEETSVEMGESENGDSHKSPDVDDRSKSSRSLSPLKRDEGQLDFSSEEIAVSPSASFEHENEDAPLDRKPSSADKDGLAFISAKSEYFDTPEPSVQSRLDRVETMLEQLLMLSTANAAGPATGHRYSNVDAKEDPATAELRREVADLQKQVTEQRNFYQEALATANLRQEVADLRREAAGIKGTNYQNADTSTLRNEVEAVRSDLDAAKGEEDSPSSEDTTAGGLRRKVAALKMQLAHAQGNARSRWTGIPSQSSLKSSLSKSTRSAAGSRRKTSGKRVLFASEPPVKTVLKPIGSDDEEEE